MKLPKKTKRFCPKCKKHTESTISQAKQMGRNKARPMSRGAIKTRVKARGLGIGAGNLGRYGSKPAIAKFKRTGAKISKKVDLRYKCAVCGKMHVQRQGFRAKKVEFE